MAESDEFWDKLIEHNIVQEGTGAYEFNTELFLVVEPQRNRFLGFKVPLLDRTYNVAFTDLDKVKGFIKNLNEIGVI